MDHTAPQLVQRRGGMVTSFDPGVVVVGGDVDSEAIIDERGRPSVVSSHQRSRGMPLIGPAPRQRLTYWLLVTAWAAAVVALAAWWFRSEHVVSVPRLLVSSALLAWTVLLPGWFLFFVGRVATTEPAVPLPAGRVAMVVTKAPSEPWAVVRQTLEGALTQAHLHDTWLADERPDIETLQWCAENGVSVCTRHGVEEYHRPSWPRRTRSKEGNLSYFYDTIGYRSYDFVVQLDADHVPEPGYLEAMLRPFADPAVGYVSAPSICDANADRSWAVRARAYAEAGLHGAIQAGANRGFAPLCIGSHYAVRTRALREIGGLGPELAEDHSTTLLMNAAGWRGIHALDAIAHGHGPESYSDLMVQELQWSRSLVNLLLGLTPRVLRPMSWPLRIQFLFSQLWYPAFGFVMLASVVAPIVALLTGTPWMRLSYLFFLAYAFTLSTVVMSVVAWIRRQGWLRPVDAPLLSWEAGLFQLLRWPWVLAGTLAGVADSIRGAAFPFKVTPKGGSEAKPIPFLTVAPHLLVAAVSAAATVFIDDAGEAKGYYWFTLLNAVLYTVAVAAAVLLHRRENPTDEGERRRVRAHLAAVGAVGLLTLAACASRGDDIGGALTWTGDAPPSTTLAVADPARDAGVIDIPAGSVNLGIYDFLGDYVESDRFAIGHHFVSWLDTNADEIAALVAPDAALGRWPLLTVEPEPLPGREDTLLVDVATGRYDEHIERVCAGLTELGTPAFVRWGHEMEAVTGRYAWATDDSAAYVSAFQRFETGCRELLGDDLYMVWSPLGEDGLEAYWPGPDHVDYIGLPVFDFPEYAVAVGGDPEWTFDDLFAEKYRRVAGFDKPVMVAEFGTTRIGADKVDWINEAFANTTDYPLLRTIVFFHAPDTEGVWGDDVDTPNWRVEPSTLPNGNP